MIVRAGLCDTRHTHSMKTSRDRTQDGSRAHSDRSWSQPSFDPEEAQQDAWASAAPHTVFEGVIYPLIQVMDAEQEDATPAALFGARS